MKNIILYILVLCILVISIILINYKKDKVNNHINFNEIEYYKKNNLNRYLNYYKQNKKLSLNEIIIRVNLNLDRNYYTSINETKFYNKEYIFINKYTYMNSKYVPNNLEKLDLSYSRPGMMLVNIAKINLEKMIKDAKKENINIRVMSSYRSYDYQVNLYTNYIKKDGKALADTYSARPGFSEHQTGLSIDIDDQKELYTNFHKTEAYKWMINNSYKYGFILRYPKNKENITGYTYESWHYRYVGKKIAKYIKKHNITFDEYYAMYLY